MDYNIQSTKRITDKRQLKDWIREETLRYSGGKKYKFGIKYFLQLRELDILVKHNVLLRKTEYYINTHKKLRAAITKIKLRKLQNKYALHISPNCFGKGLKIAHLGPILVNEKVTCGENCTLHMNVSIVAAKGDFQPKLGNDIIVCVGAIVLGGIDIADGVTIGAGAVVNKSVLEKGATVAGVPAKIINHKDNLNEQ